MVHPLLINTFSIWFPRSGCSGSKLLTVMLTRLSPLRSLPGMGEEQAEGGGVEGARPLAPSPPGTGIREPNIDFGSRFTGRDLEMSSPLALRQRYIFYNQYNFFLMGKNIMKQGGGD